MREQFGPPHDGEPSAALRNSARRLRYEAGALAEAFEQTGNELDAFLRQELTEHPYTVLLGAAGLGFVFGGGLATRLTRMALGWGGRVAVAVAANRLTTTASP